MYRAPTYSLTPALLAARVGASVFCLAESGVGRTYRLHEERPGAQTLARRYRMSDESVSWMTRAEMLTKSLASPTADLPSGAAHVIAPVASEPALIRVDISGPLEQRAGYQGECGGYLDGHDAVAERLCAAFAEGDVLLVIDGPGGAAAGIQQAVERALAAKARYGRRCTGFGDEQIASAHAWWALALCDELFIPPQGEVGSIGARGGHLSTAGMMAQAGLVMTYFADPPAKVALAPEFPLSEEGARRGMRDVSIAADAFRAAVCAGPIGQRYGLTPEGLIALGADMLTGQMAVDAGLADGVESLETVTAYALTLAESSGAKDIETRATGAARASTKGDEAMPGTKAEGDEKPKMDDEDAKTKGSDIPTACAACGIENNKVAKFCMGCGESMATKAVDDEPPPSSKPAARVAKAIAAPARMATEASLATILGATSDSPLALKNAAIGLRQIRDTAVGITGKTSPGEIVGMLLTVPERLAVADLAVVNERKNALLAAEGQRRNLASRLAKLSLAGWAPTNIYTGPVVDGRRALSPVIASMDLGILKGMVEGYEASAPRGAPFEAGRDKANADAKTREATEGVAIDGGVPQIMDGKPTKAQIERAKTNPTVIKMFAAQGNTHPIETIAEQYVIAAAQNGATL